MRICIVGDFNKDSLSMETINSINNSIHLKGRVDLLLLDSPLLIQVPQSVMNIYTYNHILGENVVERKILMVEHYINKYNPDLIIVSNDETGTLVSVLSELNDSLGYRDCFDIKVHENIIVSRTIYGGNVKVDYNTSKGDVLSFRYGLTLNSKSPLLSREVELINYEDNYESNVLLKETTQSKSTSVEDEDFVIVCGYGVGSVEDVDVLRTYAKSVGACLAGTKKVIDMGWLPPELMIGQTGHIIAPKLLLTIGVSGAAPLLNGIMDAKTIVSINNDPDARIFEFSDYGIVGDYKEVLKGDIPYEDN